MLATGSFELGKQDRKDPQMCHNLKDYPWVLVSTALGPFGPSGSFWSLGGEFYVLKGGRVSLVEVQSISMPQVRNALGRFDTLGMLILG